MPGAGIGPFTKQIVTVRRAFDVSHLPEAMSAGKINAFMPTKSSRCLPTELDREAFKWWHLIKKRLPKK